MTVSPAAAARILHWAIAAAVLGALASGYVLTRPGAFSATLLQGHLALGLTAGLLSLLRVLMWILLGAPPTKFQPLSKLQETGARWVHGLLRLVPLVLLASGVGMIALSGSFAAIAEGTLSGLAAFEPLPPRRLHHAAALLLAALVGLHGLAAIGHAVQRPRPSAG